MKPYFLLLVLVSLLWNCQPAPKKAQLDALNEIEVGGEAQGTTYTVKYIGEELPNLKAELDSLLDEVDQSMSTYIPESIISRLNLSDSFKVDSMFETVFKLSKTIHQETDGAFDPSLGPLFKAWGFDYSEPSAMDSAMVDSLMQFCGMNQFQLSDQTIIKNHPSASLNFNAIAQGYAVDLMASQIERYGIENYYVELGGELKVKGKNGKNSFWRIGIDKPDSENMERELRHIVELENKAMATSGNYRNYYEVDGKKYSHTIDPKTGFPVRRNVLSATVIAPSCAYADALATALMVKELEASISFLENQSKVSAIIIYSDASGNMKSYVSEELKRRVEAL